MGDRGLGRVLGSSGKADGREARLIGLKAQSAYRRNKRVKK